MSENEPHFIESIAIKAALGVETFVAQRSQSESERIAQKTATLKTTVLNRPRFINLKRSLALVGVAGIFVGCMGLAISSFVNPKESNSRNFSRQLNPSNVEVKLGNQQSRFKRLGYKDVATFQYGAIRNMLPNLQIEADPIDMLKPFSGQGIGPNEAQVYVSILPQSPTSDSGRVILGEILERDRAYMEPIYRFEQPLNRGGYFIHPIFLDEVESIALSNNPGVDKTRDQNSSRYTLALTEALNLEWLKRAHYTARSINSAKGIKEEGQLPDIDLLRKYGLSFSPFTVTFYKPE